MARPSLPFCKGQGHGSTSLYLPVSLSLLMNILTLTKESWSVRLCIKMPSHVVKEEKRRACWQEINSAKQLQLLSSGLCRVVSVGQKMLQYVRDQTHLQVVICGWNDVKLHFPIFTLSVCKSSTLLKFYWITHVESLSVFFSSSAEVEQILEVKNEKFPDWIMEENHWWPGASCMTQQASAVTELHMWQCDMSAADFNNSLCSRENNSFQT